jgi:hypothetical protein
MILLGLKYEETDLMVERAVGIWPSLHSPIAKSCRPLTTFSDETEYQELLQYMLLNQYLPPRGAPKSRGEFDIERLFDMSDNDFRQAARTTKHGFIQVLNTIFDNEVFHCGGHRPQLPIPHQLLRETQGENQSSRLTGQ